MSGEFRFLSNFWPCEVEYEDIPVVRECISADILAAKFKEPWLRDQLIATGDAELIEGNTWNDTFWGVCNGKGSNFLGKALMDIRKKLTTPTA
jgi:hypothetical protein